MANHLLKAIVWVIITLIGIMLGFYFLKENRINLELICYFSLAGFLTAFREYYNYKQSKKTTRWEE